MGNYTKEQRVTKAQRESILARDGTVCQYCGLQDKPERLVIEHVIPAVYDGPAQPYNLVVACIPCNRRKNQRVWIPRNFSVITEGQDAWAARVQALSTPILKPSRSWNVTAIVTDEEHTALEIRAAQQGIAMVRLVYNALDAQGLLSMPDEQELKRIQAAD